VDVNCVHPGGVRTRLFRDVGGPLGLLFTAAQVLRMSPEAAARGVVHAACDLPAGTTGRYLANGWFGIRFGRPSRLAEDDALARRIYEEDCLRTGLTPVSA
jgi:NAD(P)-dependent dehydrogenase (short-subunit alcohol dehydrogenase family)